MPKVPTYNSPKVQEAAAPMPMQNASLPSGAFGEGIGRGLSDVADMLYKAQEDADNVKAVESDTLAADRMLKLTDDPKEGFANVKGRNILTPGPDGKTVSQSYLERAKQIGADLEKDMTPGQVEKFRRRFSQRLLGFQESLTKHESREISAHMKAATEGNVRKNYETAIAHSDDPAMVEMSVQNIIDTLKAQGARDGLPADAQEAVITEQVSALRYGVMAAAADAGNLDYAREQFNQFGESMTAADRLKMKKVLDEGDFEVRTQTGAETVWSESGGDVSKALELARKRFKGKEEDGIVQRIKGFDAERVTLRERAQNDAADMGWKLASQGKSPAASLYAAMDGRDAMAIRRQLAEGSPRKTNIAKWLEFTNKTPEQLATMAPNELLREYGAHFADSDIRNANEIILAARGKPSKEGLQLMTTADLVNRSARELGILPTSGKASEEQEAAFDAFRSKMQVNVNAWEAANGKKATPEVLQQMLTEEKLNKVKLEAWWSDPEKAVVTLDDEDMGRAYVQVGKEAIKLASIPAEQRQLIVQALQNNRRPVTEAAIAEYWVRAGKPTATKAAPPPTPSLVD